MMRRPPISTLFPYPTLFRSNRDLRRSPPRRRTRRHDVAALRPVQPVLLRVQRHLRGAARSEEHTSELQSRQYLVCRLLLEKKKLIIWKANEKSTLALLDRQT